MSYELRQHHQYTCDMPKCGTVVTYDGNRHTKEQADRKVVRECGFVFRPSMNSKTKTAKAVRNAGKVFHFCEEHADWVIE